MQKITSYQAQQTYTQILTDLEQRNIFKDNEKEKWESFLTRLHPNFFELINLLYQLYFDRFDFYYQIKQLWISLWEAYKKRPQYLKNLDIKREKNPLWFQDQNSLAAVCYLDRYAGTIQNFETKIPYLKELGINILHLMPLFQTPQPQNDGGYAISNYRKTDPKIGSIQELKKLIKDLRSANISTALDFVFNHTANDHPWAQKAIKGEQKYKDYYYLFPDRTLPNQYEQHLREIFPEEKPGSFTFLPETNQWVWTTFNTYQWDLNFSNPEVFKAITEEMFFIANLGVEILRMDAVPFIWKELGTSCENLPQVHTLLQAFNLVAKIVAPSLIFISEAIVHPNDVNSYINQNECKISYNPLMMATSWEALATRETKLLQKSIEFYYEINQNCSWLNYVRVHDDIGWTYSDENAWEVGINPYDHRRFLNDFYIGTFPGSFAKGVSFQHNLKTGDQRICGTCASLAGLEKAIKEEGQTEIDLAIKRITLLYGLTITSKGIPLIYLGDELATLNDHSYLNYPQLKNDSRWTHRPIFDQERFAQRNDPSTPAGKTYHAIQNLITLRRSNPILALGEMIPIHTGLKSLLAFVRQLDQQKLISIYNFSEQSFEINQDFFTYHLGQAEIIEIISKNKIKDTYQIEPYQIAIFQIKNQ